MQAGCQLLPLLRLHPTHPTGGLHASSRSQPIGWSGPEIFAVVECCPSERRRQGKEKERRGEIERLLRAPAAVWAGARARGGRQTGGRPLARSRPSLPPTPSSKSADHGLCPVRCPAPAQCDFVGFVVLAASGDERLGRQDGGRLGPRPRRHASCARAGPSTRPSVRSPRDRLARVGRLLDGACVVTRMSSKEFMADPSPSSPNLAVDPLLIPPCPQRARYSGATGPRSSTCPGPSGPFRSSASFSTR